MGKIYTGCGRPDNYHYKRLRSVSKRFDKNSPQYGRRRSVFVRLDAEEVRQKAIDYYYGNRTACLTTAAEYRAANREQYREWNAAWYERNKESVKAYQRANRKALTARQNATRKAKRLRLREAQLQGRIAGWQTVGKLCKLVKDLSEYGSVLTIWVNSEDRSVRVETKYVGVEVAQSGQVGSR